jgi:hypothetical protein
MSMVVLLLPVCCSIRRTNADGRHAFLPSAPPGRATVRLGDVSQLPEAAAPQLVRMLRPGGSALIYDFPWAPFEKLNTTKVRTPISTGNPFIRRCVRLTLAA